MPAVAHGLLAYHLRQLFLPGLIIVGIISIGFTLGWLTTPGVPILYQVGIVVWTMFYSVFAAGWYLFKVVFEYQGKNALSLLYCLKRADSDVSNIVPDDKTLVHYDHQIYGPLLAADGTPLHAWAFEYKGDEVKIPVTKIENGESTERVIANRLVFVSEYEKDEAISYSEKSGIAIGNYPRRVRIGDATGIYGGHVQRLHVLREPSLQRKLMFWKDIERKITYTGYFYLAGHDKLTEVLQAQMVINEDYLITEASGKGQGTLSVTMGKTVTQLFKPPTPESMTRLHKFAIGIDSSPYEQQNDLLLNKVEELEDLNREKGEIIIQLGKARGEMEGEGTTDELTKIAAYGLLAFMILLIAYGLADISGNIPAAWPHIFQQPLQPIPNYNPQPLPTTPPVR